jgi:hypothetical protein
MKAVSRLAMAALVLSFGAVAAMAQPAAPAASSPSAVVRPLTTPPPPAGREPVFVPPPPVRDDPEIDWRAANDEAARLGGHVGQMRGRR